MTYICYQILRTKNTHIKIIELRKYIGTCELLCTRILHANDFNLQN